MKKTIKLMLSAGLGLSLLACNNKQQTNDSTAVCEEQIAVTELEKMEKDMKIDFGLQKQSLTIRDDILMMSARCTAPVDIKTIFEKKETTCALLYVKNYKAPELLPNGVFKVRYALVSDTMIEMQVIDNKNKVLSVLNQIYFEPELRKIPNPGTLTVTPTVPDYNCIPSCMERLRPTFIYYQNLANTTCHEIRQCFACRCKDGSTAYVMMLFTPLRAYRCYLTQVATMMTDRTLVGGGKETPAIP
jgi:hypothetical protein